MNVWLVGALVAGGLGSVGLQPMWERVDISRTPGQYQGIVEQVWEDGFRLNTGDRTFRVDSWDVYGDATASYLSVGDRVTLTGEFDGGEFDAFTITPAGAEADEADAPAAAAAAPAATPETAVAPAAPATPASPGTYSGIVEQVWEDGFRLNTGDRTFRVDSWDVYGDATTSYLSVGDRVTLTGEFDDGEFDAFTITPAP